MGPTKTFLAQQLALQYHRRSQNMEMYLLFFITNLDILLPNLQTKYIRSFTHFYSFQDISMATGQFPFQIDRSQHKVLGKFHGTSPQTLENFLPLHHKIKQDLTRWHTGNTSWFGRVSILKMNTPSLYLILTTSSSYTTF